MKKSGLFLLTALIASCSKPAEIPHTLHYVVGNPYSVGTTWMYPEENFNYQATGLAMVSSMQKGTITTDGEVYNPRTMTGGHQTLQLPSVVKVRNLDNGREIVIRLNNREPSTPTRILSLTPLAAEMLGISKNGVAKVEIIEDESQSRNIALQLPNGPQLPITAAPVGEVQQQDLNNPSSTKTLGGNDGSSTLKSVNNPILLTDFPTTYVQGTPRFSQIFIDGGSFTSKNYAYRLAAQMNGRLVPVVENNGRAVTHVRVGPFNSVSEADHALENFLSSGIKGAKIVIE
ncbi:MAG: RlpA-like double-psi beta-barrel domain-containing protein [Commensalibacter sp.]